MTKYLCVGGEQDGRWLTLRELRKLKREYEPMPIRAPSYPQAFAFKVFKARHLTGPDVVLLLIDGYRMAPTCEPPDR